MAGGLLQLVSTGAQNIYLNGNPSLSFFKKVYKTHTNFAMESMRINFDKIDIRFNDSTILTTRIDRNADLITNLYLVLTLPDIRKREGHVFNFVENLGESMIEEYYLNIGGNIVDRQFGEWLHIWNELSLSSNKRYGYDKMIGNVPEVFRPDDFNKKFANGAIQVPSRKIIVPLQFWFNNIPGLAIPLIALQYHVIEIGVRIKPLKDLILENHQKVTDYSLYFESEHINVSPYLECNYVFLDTQERTYFAQHSLDYLIERVQRIPFYGVNTFNALDLTLQHPVKEIIWVIKRNDTKDTNKWFDFGDSTDEGKKVEVLKKAKITFNGLDRFEAKDPQYFNVIQPYQHHTVVPKEGVYVYSFSLFPEKFQPSGACNMSRIKNIQLHLELASPLRDDYKYDVFVYVTSYNFLRIASGMAGIAFAC
jgi:hypothetical protein